jgi:hypothetical protein
MVSFSSAFANLVLTPFGNGPDFQVLAQKGHDNNSPEEWSKPISTASETVPYANNSFNHKKSSKKKLKEKQNRPLSFEGIRFFLPASKVNFYPAGKRQVILIP